MEVQKGVVGLPLWRSQSVQERAGNLTKNGADTLYRCRNPWAVRRQFVNVETGEVIRARCNCWECPHCGPRKVDLWRQLVAEAKPVLFLTLTKAGITIEQAARAFQTFIQALRRGSKGRGKNHVGARKAYPVEYFAVLEEHEDVENLGFHWHVLIVGVEDIPYKDVIQPLWMSATHYDEMTGQGAKIAWIERIRSNKAIGYVTKYLLKAVAVAQRGVREVKRERSVASEDELGNVFFERQEVTEEVVSKARRIRYSRHFFPESVAALREKLFNGMEEHLMETCELASGATSEEGQSDNGKPIETKQASSWQLVERDVEEVVNVEEYKQRRYAELTEGLVGLRGTDPAEYAKEKKRALADLSREVYKMVGGVYQRLSYEALVEALGDDKPISRRVISMWDYQRKQLGRVD